MHNHAIYFPAITSEPEDQTVLVGGSASLTVAISATTPASSTYQWFFNNDELLDVPGFISGSTSDTLTLSDARIADGGDYFVRVTSAAPSTVTDSAVATVTVYSIVSTPPSSVTVPLGEDITFTATVMSSAAITYLWLFEENPITLDRITGTTTNTLSIPNVEVSDAGVYFVDITISQDTLISSPRLNLFIGCK